MSRLWYSFLKLLPLVIMIALIPLLAEWGDFQRQAVAPASAPDEVPESDLRITRGRFTETKNGKLVWQVEADSAQLYESKELAQLENVRAFAIQKDGKRIHLTGDTGELCLKSNDLAVKNNVLVTYEDGLILSSQSLRWKSSREEITTDDWVEVKWKNIRLTAKGMEMFNRLGKINMKDQVTTYFN